jgi:uncharacterized protein YjiS (DUF1127 family)
MSMVFGNAGFLAVVRRHAPVGNHQSNSWLRLLYRSLSCSERMHQRTSLRDIADDPHLLADLGLTREEALKQANTPFWR